MQYRAKQEYAKHYLKTDLMQLITELSPVLMQCDFRFYLFIFLVSVSEIFFLVLMSFSFIFFVLVLIFLRYFLVLVSFYFSVVF